MAFKIKYTDIALGAAEDAEVTSTGAEKFSSLGLLPFGANTGAIATSEPNGWGLSQDYKVRGEQQFSFWSVMRSDANGVFTTVPRVIIEFTEQYTSTGLTFLFSPGAAEYCTEMDIYWQQGGVTKDKGTFYPTSATFAVERTVEAFDRVIVDFKKTNLPERRLKLERLAIGVFREFTGRELTSASVLHEIDLVSNTVPVNVLDADFHSETDVDFVFQKKQPVEAFDGEELIGVYYIETGERTGGNHYSISCQDAIGVLELDTYKGGLFLTDTPIEDVLLDIVGNVFAFDISEELKGATVRGYIPESTKRAAIQQVAFSLGACVDTSGTAKIKLFLPSSEGAKEIPEKETYIGGKVTTADIVTGVNVTYYEITDERPGGNDESIEIDGIEYKIVSNVHSVQNPNTTAGVLKNDVDVDGCYLINTNNVQQRANGLLLYYMRRDTYSFSHVLNGQKLCGHYSAHLPWGDIKTGNIKKMKITVSNLTASDTEFLID